MILTQHPVASDLIFADCSLAFHLLPTHEISPADPTEPGLLWLGVPSLAPVAGTPRAVSRGDFEQGMKGEERRGLSPFFCQIS